MNLFDAYAFSGIVSFLAKKRETFDSADELLDAGWRVRLTAGATPATFAFTYWRLRPMSVWSNHEYFDHLPDRDPTAPLESPWTTTPTSTSRRKPTLRKCSASRRWPSRRRTRRLKMMAAYFAQHWCDPPF